MKKIRIKWASGNMPVVVCTRNDARYYLTKRELVDLRHEIDEFVKFYEDDFSDKRIDIEDEEYDFDWSDLHDKKDV